MGANYRKELEAGGGGTPMIGGNISARGSMSSKADARREIADLNNPKGKRSSAREDYIAGKGTRADQKAQIEAAGKKLGERMASGESLDDIFGMKKGGAVKSKASSRADGCAKRGKTKGRIC